MPWIGVSMEGERVIPEEVSDDDVVLCPMCENGMYPRGPTVDGKARHFVHNRQEGTNCAGVGVGESDLHRKWKSMVLSGLRQWFPEQISQSEPEVTLDVERTSTKVDIRSADVCLEFDPEHPVFGKGLVIEVQHKNRAKNQEAVNHDYVVLGYSTYWTDESDFTDDRFKLHRMIEAFQSNRPRQQGAIVASEVTPLQFDPVRAESTVEETGESNSSSGNQHSLQSVIHDLEPPEQLDDVPLQDDDGHVVPQIPDCAHNFPWGFEDDRDTCKKCGTTIHQVTRRIFDSEKWSSPSKENCIAETKSRVSGSTIKSAEYHDYDDQSTVEEAQEDEDMPYCDDRIWRLDGENDVYVCFCCGNTYPRDNDTLRDQLQSG